METVVEFIYIQRIKVFLRFHFSQMICLPIRENAEADILIHKLSQNQ